MFDRKSYWATINGEVEAQLERALPIREPLIVHQPMHDLVFSAPKSPAPALCIAACELVGGHRSDALSTAAAINLIQASTYVHQHLPNLLEKPSPSVFPDNIRLMSGDAISPLGFELLAGSDGTRRNPERVLRVIIEIARAMGAQGLVEGQYMHVKWAHSKPSMDEDEEALMQFCGKKEGTIYGCGAACGAILGGAGAEEVEKLRRYGFYVGMIYGMLSYGIGRENRGGMADKFRSLAVKELEGFEAGKVGPIISIADGCLDEK